MVYRDVHLVIVPASSLYIHQVCDSIIDVGDIGA